MEGSVNETNIGWTDKSWKRMERAVKLETGGTLICLGCEIETRGCICSPLESGVDSKQ